MDAPVLKRISYITNRVLWIKKMTYSWEVLLSGGGRVAETTEKGSQIAVQDTNGRQDNQETAGTDN